jgi:hypothetical protein
MAQQMKNQGQRNNLHPPKKFLPASANKSYQHTIKRPGQVSRINTRQQTELETTFNQEEKTNGPEKPKNSTGS